MTRSWRLVVLAALAGACLPALARAEPAFGPLDQQFRISFMGPNGRWEYQALEPSIAYNSTADEYLVVWVGDDNTPPLVDNEWEIFGQRLSGAGKPLGGRIRVSAQGADGNLASSALEPSVAYNAYRNEYLVVWRGDVGDGTTDDFEIWGRRLSATGDKLGGSDDLQLSEMGGPDNAIYDAYRPSVAANPTTGEYLVVWSGDTPGQGLADDEFEIFGQRVSAEGVELPPYDFRISEQGADGNEDSDADEPSVAYNPARDEYLVAWQGDVGTGALDLIEIWAQRLSGTGAEVGGSDFPVSRSGAETDDSRFDDLTPSVAANPTTGEYLVVWEADGPFFDDEFEIFAQLLSGGGARVGAPVRVSDQGPDSDPRFDALDPSVTYDPSAGEYLVAWQGDGFASPPVDYEFEIFAQRLSAAGEQVGGDFRISHTGQDGNSIDEASRSSSAANPARGEYLVVWQGAEQIKGSLNTEVEIFGHRLGLAAPMLVTTDPPGPANENNPRVKGTVDQDSTVDVFENSRCLGAPVVNDAPASALNGVGIQVPVSDNTVTDFSATASSDGRTSRCSNSIAYTEVSPPAPPHCSDVSQTVLRATATAVALPCTDEEGDPMTRAIVSPPTQGSAGSIDQAGGTVPYTPNRGPAGPDSFTFRASDASGDSEVATVSLTVAGCVEDATFASIGCRLDDLVAARAAGVPNGRLAKKLGRLLTRAEERLTAAEAARNGGRTRAARKALGKAAKALGAFDHGLGTRAARHLDPATVASLRAAAAALRRDVVALRG